MQLERQLGLNINNIMFSLPTLASPNQDLLSDKFNWCLKEESGEYGAETAELHFEGFLLCE